MGTADVVQRRVLGCDWSRDRSDMAATLYIEDVLEQYLVSLGVPVVHGLPMGHCAHLTTTSLGVQATLEADARTLTIDEAAPLP